MKQSVAILGSALLLATPLAADTNVVTTDPVGVMRYVFQANSDSSMSLPLHRPTEFAGAVGSVGSNWITAFATSNSPINWVNNDWTYGVGTNANNTYYAMFTTGALEGAWFQITGNNSNTLFLDTAGLASLATAGVAASNSFEVVPFWTLNTVFVGGTGITATTSLFSLKSFVILMSQTNAGVNLPSSAAYVYYTGAGGIRPAGWYNAGNLFAGPNEADLPLDPDTFVLIRDLSSSTTTNFVTGSVEMFDHRTTLGRIENGKAQDNFVALSFPVDSSLAESGLATSPGFTPTSNLFALADFVLVYNQDGAGINKPNSAAYIYYNGQGGFRPAGWYDAGNLFAGPSYDTNKIFRAGQGYTIRKGSGPAAADFWVASPSYAP